MDIKRAMCWCNVSRWTTDWRCVVNVHFVIMHCHITLMYLRFIRCNQCWNQHLHWTSTSMSLPCVLQYFHSNFCSVILFFKHVKLLHAFSLSILTSVFPGEHTLAGFIWAKDDGSGGDKWSYKMCKAPVKSSPINQHPTNLYRPYALLVANQQEGHPTCKNWCVGLLVVIKLKCGNWNLLVGPNYMLRSVFIVWCLKIR